MKFLLPLFLALMSSFADHRPVQFEALRFQLPAEWTTVPPTALEQGATVRAWATPDGRYLQLDYWPGLPPSPGGPMQAVQHWPVQVLGHRAELVQTSLFRSRPDEVLLIMLATGPQYYRLFARGESRERLVAVLQSMRWAGGGDVQTR